MINFIKKLKIHFALNESKPKREKNLNARNQADKAKTILHTHKKRKPQHHKKVIVKN